MSTVKHRNRSNLKLKVIRSHFLISLRLFFKKVNTRCITGPGGGGYYLNSDDRDDRRIFKGL